MCGLLGWTVTDDHAETTAHAIMVAMVARSMDTRGGHSHGAWTGDRLIKGLGDLVTSNEITMVDLARSPFVLGHTRFATVGARTRDNAHPWAFSHEGRTIIGAHNGQVSNHWALNITHARQCDVDSMHLFEHIIRGQSLKEIQAYGAITYADMDRTVHLGRFNNGELSVLIVKDAGIYWASTESALKYAAWAAGIVPERLQTLKHNRRYVLTLAGGLVKDGPLHVGKYQTWDYGTSTNRGETKDTKTVSSFVPGDTTNGGHLSPVDRASALLDGENPEDHVFEEIAPGEGDIEWSEDDAIGNRITDPFHWTADGQAAYNEFCANERGSEEDLRVSETEGDRYLIDAFKRNRRARRRLAAKTQRFAGMD